MPNVNDYPTEIGKGGAIIPLLEYYGTLQSAHFLVDGWAETAHGWVSTWLSIVRVWFKVFLTREGV